MQANFEGIRFRRFASRSVELYMMRNGDSREDNGEVWVALDVVAFKRFFASVVDRLEWFNKRPASIKWN